MFKKLLQTGKQILRQYDKLISSSYDDKPTSKQKNQHQNKKQLILNQNTEKTVIQFSLINVSKIIIIAILLIGAALLLYHIREVLMIFFVSMLFAAALDPTIDKLEQYKIPRSISSIVIFILIITVTSLFLGSMIPIVGQQMFEVGKNTNILLGNIIEGRIELPKYLEWLNPMLKEMFEGIDTEEVSNLIQNTLLRFSEDLKGIAGNAVTLLKELTNGLTNAVLILFFTYFMIVDEEEIDAFILKLFPSKHDQYITEKSKVIKTKVGLWLRGQIILMILIGILTYIGLKLINLEYAFTLAIFAGITELIPVIGPIIAWVATIPIAANSDQALNTIIWVTLIYFIIQRIESVILIPVVMKHATGLHPIMVLFAMLVGYQLMGLLGTVISVPVSAIIAIFLNDYLSKERK